MNRPFAFRNRPVAGVLQRCKSDCPADACAQHKWAYTIELPAAGATGKRRQITKGGFATGKAAMEARADIAKQHRDKTLPDDLHRTLGSWLDEWLKSKVDRKEIEDTTARGYSDNIKNYIRPKLGHIKIRDLRGIDLTRFYAEIAEERAKARLVAIERNEQLAAEMQMVNDERRLAGYTRMLKPKRVAVPRTLGPASIARVHACISGALSDAVPDLAPRNVAKDAKLPKVEKRKVRPPAPEVLGGFLDDVTHERLYPLLVVAGYSGLRRGELVGMQWGDVDLRTGKVVIGRQIVSVGYKLVERDTKTESGQDRIVFLDAVVRDILTEWAVQQLTERSDWGQAYVDDGRGWMFTKEDGTLLHPDYVTKVAARLLRRHGLETSLHGLRHFWAAALISSGADISAVSKAMGHANIAVTSDIYGSLFDKSAAAMFERGAALIPRRAAA
jgi:integrase